MATNVTWYYADTETEAAKLADFLRYEKRIGIDVEFRPQERYLREEWLPVLYGDDDVSRFKLIKDNVDFKAVSFDPYRNELVTVQIGTMDSKGRLYAGIFFVPTIGTDVLGNILRPYLQRDGLVCVAQNANTEAKHLKHHMGIQIDTWKDTMLHERVLTSGLMQMRTGLGHLRVRYLGYDQDEALEEKETTRLSFIYLRNDGLTEEQLSYVARDAADVLPILDLQEEIYAQAENARLREVVRWEDQLVPVIADMELRGISVDNAAWTKLADAARDHCRRLYDELQRIFLAKEYKDYVKAVGDKFGDLDVAMIKIVDPNSPLDTLRALHSAGYKKIGNIELNDTGDESLINYRRALILALRKKGVSEDKIKELRRPFDLLMEYRTWGQRLKMYGHDYLVKYINPVTGFIHANVNQYGAVSGRLIYSDPNLQQIPSRDEEASGYRKAFIARRGYLLVWGDWSQIEPRILAYASGDPTLLQVFTDNLDVHSMAAARFLGQDYDILRRQYKDKDDPAHDAAIETRTLAKTTGLGVNYGMGARRLSIRTAEVDPDGVGVPAYCSLSWDQVNEGSRCTSCARCALLLYRDTFGVSLQYLEERAQFTIENLMSEDLAGGRRYFTQPDRYSTAMKMIEKRDKSVHKQIQDGYVDIENVIHMWHLEGDITKNMESQLHAMRLEGRNHVIQGTNGRMMKIAMYNVWRRIRELGAYVLLVVHDEIVCEAPEDKAELVKNIIVEEMTNAAQFFLPGLPTPVDPTIGATWSK